MIVFREDKYTTYTAGMIIKLHQNLINQIAAGEVVERPASILKELLENAIDAGATRINIHLSNNGLKRIEVRDNGIGMSKDDALIACESHTTSKISTLQDLETIQSMGFRGEALASIASVSNLNMLTKLKNAPSGIKINIIYGKKTKSENIQTTQGTTMIVQDLFSRIPARKKFLKSPNTEYKHLHSVFINYALAFPHIHFTFQHNEKELYNLPATQEDSFNKELEIRLHDIYSRELLADIVDIQYNAPNIKIFGYIGHPRTARSTKTHQNIFLNKRPIEDRVISKAVIDAYTTFIPKGRYPVYFLFLEMDTEDVDINVHPRKTEVRFHDSQLLYKSAFTATRGTLIKFLKQDSDKALKQYKHLISSPRIADRKKQRASTSSLNRSSSKKDSLQDSLIFTKELLKETPHDMLPSEIMARSFQVFDTYIIIEKKDRLLIIDQHAAAERVTFDKLKEQFAKKKVDTQKLLLPESIEIAEGDHKLIARKKELLRRLGFSYRTVRNQMIKIDAVPALLARSNIRELFHDLIAELTGETTSNTLDSVASIRDSIIASISCHTSIRAGMRLTKEEINDLVTKLLACKHPYSCPHGRPIIWNLSKSEIEKHVARH